MGKPLRKRCRGLHEARRPLGRGKCCWPVRFPYRPLGKSRPAIAAGRRGGYLEHRRARQSSIRKALVLAPSTASEQGGQERRSRKAAGSDNCGKRQLREHGRLSWVHGRHVATLCAAGGRCGVGCFRYSINDGNGFVKRFAKLFLLAAGQV